MLKLLLCIIAVLLFSCAHTPQPKKEVVYSATFMDQIQTVKELYRKGKVQDALSHLSSIAEVTLAPQEIAQKKNLQGVIYYSKGQFKESAVFFNAALAFSSVDESLTAQIYLNLAGSNMKLGNNLAAYDALTKGNYMVLAEGERKKYLFLQFQLADGLGKKDQALTALLHYLADIDSIDRLKNEQLFVDLHSKFLTLESDQERAQIIMTFENKRNLAALYLSFLQAEKNFYQGERELALRTLAWLKEQSIFADLNGLIEKLQDRSLNITKINPRTIGVVLPLSGKKKVFAERALEGIQLALNELKSTSAESYKLEVRDSKGSATDGAAMVEQLIASESVAIIIGGLFSEEASEEYLAAKKNSTLFISLSEVYLPKEYKNHLLLEIPGSVESQIKTLLTSEVKGKLGSKIALLYPKMERGDRYASEVDTSAKEQGFQVVDAISFEKGSNDYQQSVRKILDLDSPQNRKREGLHLTEVFDKASKKYIKKEQLLPPIVRFDWVFLPAFPTDALQIIPTFKYFDAPDLIIVGDPSWRTGSILQESLRYKNLYFIGDSVDERGEYFKSKFEEQYKKSPGLIEMRSYDALTSALEFLEGEDLTAREILEDKIRSLPALEGVTGEWKQEKGLWLKKSNLLKIVSGEIKEAFVK